MLLWSCTSHRHRCTVSSNHRGLLMGTIGALRSVLRGTTRVRRALAVRSTVGNAQGGMLWRSIGIRRAMLRRAVRAMHALARLRTVPLVGVSLRSARTRTVEDHGRTVALLHVESQRLLQRVPLLRVVHVLQGQLAVFRRVVFVRGLSINLQPRERYGPDVGEVVLQVLPWGALLQAQHQHARAVPTHPVEDHLDSPVPQLTAIELHYRRLRVRWVGEAHLADDDRAVWRRRGHRGAHLAACVQHSHRARREAWSAALESHSSPVIDGASKRWTALGAFALARRLAAIDAAKFHLPSLIEKLLQFPAIRANRDVEHEEFCTRLRTQVWLDCENSRLKGLLVEELQRLLCFLSTTEAHFSDARLASLCNAVALPFSIVRRPADVRIVNLPSLGEVVLQVLPRHTLRHVRYHNLGPVGGLRV
mmetsp:Transcript_81856/g.228049  ORF Transcript_81856/g.228049 Transcript_81856/m.228049 type:complete len:420 (+) Transcript_81856:786-2045(+)